MIDLSLAPPLLMVLFACATLVAGVLGDRRRNDETPRDLIVFNLIGQLLIGFTLLRQWLSWQASGTVVSAAGGSISVDGLALFTHSVVWLSAVALLATSYRYLELSHENGSEYYALALFAQCGMYFMGGGADLIAMFLGLELTALSFYILVGFTRSDRRSNEAALKYLLLGAVSSGFVLYGFSLVYGVSGSTTLADAHAALAGPSAFAKLAAATVLVGLLLKISAVPFHTWAPDAYDGAPTPVAGYLAVASKVAAFAVLLRILPTDQPDVQRMLMIAAVLSLTVGSLAAVTQERTKRLFAYSGMAHAGYLLLGIIAGTQEGVLIYLFAYAVMNAGAFALLTSLRSHHIPGDQVSDLRGLSRSHPLHAVLFTVILVSLAGIPPSVGFIGKYYIFVALIGTQHFVLATVAALYVAVSLFFYFRLVREMYLEPFAVSVAEPAVRSSLGVRLALGALAFATLTLGVFPEPLLRNAALLARWAQP